MKNKTIWIIVSIVIIILIIGYFTSWFGLGKNTESTQSRLINPSGFNKASCPEGYSLYTNTLNGHSICVKLATGDIVPVIKS